MKFSPTLVAVALCAGIAAPVAPLAAKPAAVKASPAAHKAACDDLAVALTPDDQVADQVDKLIAAMLKRMGEEPGMAKLEARYPGILNAAGERVRPIMLRSASLTQPLYRADLSKLYQANLTTSEARTAAAFFRSPAARAFIAAVQNNISYETSADRLYDQKNVSTSDVRAELGSAGRTAANQVTPAQRQEVAAFFSSPLGQKLIRLNPQKNAIDAKWFNYAPPGIEREVEIATMEAMIDHIAKTDPDTAKRLRDGLEADGRLPKRAS